MKYKNTRTPKEAEEAGFAPITEPYRSSEYALLDKAIDQLGGKEIMLVELGGTRLQIWRPKSQIATE